jgi:hypothetical protein
MKYAIRALAVGVFALFLTVTPFFNSVFQFSQGQNTEVPTAHAASQILVNSCSTFLTDLYNVSFGPFSHYAAIDQLLHCDDTTNATLVRAVIQLKPCNFYAPNGPDTSQCAAYYGIGDPAQNWINGMCGRAACVTTVGAVARNIRPTQTFGSNRIPMPCGNSSSGQPDPEGQFSWSCKSTINGTDANSVLTSQLWVDFRKTENLKLNGSDGPIYKTNLQRTGDIPPITLAATWNLYGATGCKPDLDWSGNDSFTQNWFTSSSGTFPDSQNSFTITVSFPSGGLQGTLTLNFIIKCYIPSSWLLNYPPNEVTDTVTVVLGRDQTLYSLSPCTPGSKITVPGNKVDATGGVLASTFSWQRQMDINDTLAMGGETTRVPWYLTSPGQELMVSGTGTGATEAYARFSGQYGVNIFNPDGSQAKSTQTFPAGQSLVIKSSALSYLLPDPQTGTTGAAYGSGDSSGTILPVGGFMAPVVNLGGSAGPAVDNCAPLQAPDLSSYLNSFNVFNATRGDGSTGPRYYFFWIGPVQYAVTATGTSNPDVTVSQTQVSVTPKLAGTLVITIQPVETTAALTFCENLLGGTGSQNHPTCSTDGKTAYRTMDFTVPGPYTTPTLTVGPGSGGGGGGTPTAPQVSCQSPVNTGTTTNPNDSALIEFKATDPEGDTVKYDLDYLYNGTSLNVMETVPTSGYVPQDTWQNTHHSWVTAGTKTIGVRATDSNGNASAITSCQVVVTPPSTPSASVDLQGRTYGAPDYSDGPVVVNLPANATDAMIDLRWIKTNVTACVGRRLYPPPQGKGSIQVPNTNWDLPIGKSYAEGQTQETLDFHFTNAELQSLSSSTAYKTVVRIQCLDSVNTTHADEVELQFTRNGQNAGVTFGVSADNGASYSSTSLPVQLPGQTTAMPLLAQWIKTNVGFCVGTRPDPDYPSKSKGTMSPDWSHSTPQLTGWPYNDAVSSETKNDTLTFTFQSTDLNPIVAYKTPLQVYCYDGAGNKYFSNQVELQFTNGGSSGGTTTGTNQTTTTTTGTGPGPGAGATYNFGRGSRRW